MLCTNLRQMKPCLCMRKFTKTPGSNHFLTLWVSTAFDNSMVLFSKPQFPSESWNVNRSSSHAVSQEPIMMCLKILLALLQSANHLREVSTETEAASETVYSRVCLRSFVSVGSASWYAWHRRRVREWNWARQTDNLYLPFSPYASL